MHPLHFVYIWREVEANTRRSSCTRQSLNTTQDLVASETTAARWHLGVRLLGVQPGGSIITGAAEVESEKATVEHQVVDV